MNLNEAKQLLKNNGYIISEDTINRSTYRNIDINSGFLDYAAKIADGARAINDYIDRLYKQIPEEEFRKDEMAIDKILSDRLCEEIFNAKAFLAYLNYESGFDAVADFVTANKEKISQLFSENPIIAKYVTRF